MPLSDEWKVWPVSMKLRLVYGLLSACMELADRLRPREWEVWEEVWDELPGGARVFIGWDVLTYGRVDL